MGGRWIVCSSLSGRYVLVCPVIMVNASETRKFFIYRKYRVKLFPGGRIFIGECQRLYDNGMMESENV